MFKYKQSDIIAAHYKKSCLEKSFKSSLACRLAPNDYNNVYQ